jgi:hypothetical protein
MKRVVLVSAVAVLCGANALPSLAVTTSIAAPADRNFGRYHMSVLGMVTRLNGLLAFADLHPEEARHTFDKAVLLEDAMMDWAKLFPRDPWIPRLTAGLAELYGKLDTDDARTRRIVVLDWLIKTYPTSSYARLPGN